MHSFSFCPVPFAQVLLDTLRTANLLGPPPMSHPRGCDLISLGEEGRDPVFRLLLVILICIQAWVQQRRSLDERIRILISVEIHLKSNWHMVTTLAAKITWKTFFKVLSQARAFAGMDTNHRHFFQGLRWFMVYCCGWDLANRVNHFLLRFFFKVENQAKIVKSSGFRIMVEISPNVCCT